MSTIITKIKINGMSCESCEKVISKKLGRLDGVTNVQVNKDTGIAAITASKSIAKEEVTAALEGTHYALAG